MKRNVKEERLTHVRREYARWDKLHDASKVKYLVPLENPVHSGWDVWVTLSESRMRSRDAPDLLKVISLLGIDKPRFWREQPYIRIIRRYNGRYDQCIGPLTKRTAHWTTLPCQNRCISRDAYERIGHLQKYFTRHEHSARGWRPAYVEYSLNHNFPSYELTFKVKKAYWTHTIMYDWDALGEAEKLHDKLWWGSYRNLTPRMLGYESRRRDDYRRSIKCAWKTTVRRLTTLSHLVHDEDWDDIELDTKTRSKVYRRKSFGWD